MKRNKSGVSLIVLVITIIVMIILAAAIIISLSNSGIIGKANEAVDANDIKQVEHIASLAWGEWYIKELEEPGSAGTALEYVTNALTTNGIDTNKYIPSVTDNGVTVSVVTTLGNIVKSAIDYGKTVNYVSDNGVTGWMVFYKQTVNNEEYVYLIASENAPNVSLPTNIPGATISGKNIYWESGNIPTTQANIENEDIWMAKWEDYSTCENGRAVSYFLSEPYWNGFKNTTATYKDYVIGTIGTPTAEMFAASYNERSVALKDTGTNSEINLIKVSYGYSINSFSLWSVTLSRQEHLYNGNTELEEYTWLSSPGDYTPGHMMVSSYEGSISGDRWHVNSNEIGVRPVVCLKSSIPAYESQSENGADIILK